MQESPNTEMLRCWAEIDGAALRHNARAAGALAGGGPECVMAVVKADAYGHRLPLVTRALKEEIGSFAVAALTEALAVKLHAARARDGSIPPIYILSPALPAEIPDIVHHGFIPAISTMDEVHRFAAAAHGKSCAVHVVLDTGMGRMGALPGDAAAVLRAVKDSPVLTLDSVSSHFPSSDEDREFTARQEQDFRRLTAALQAEFGPFRTHIANSAAILHYPRPPLETVRAGLMLYGICPLNGYTSSLRPALTWKTRITLIRELPAGWTISYGRTFTTPHPMTVAAIAAGYGDGYPRHVSGKGAAVLVHGQRCPILGRVTMDQILIDVSALPQPPAPGHEAVLLGLQGTASITPHELASQASTIPWHIYTGITDRTERLFTTE
ncbi:MAG TPA: alanine racemase [Verrucomicrobiales bacterium]|nr:alanine racemase [Verrucomicrobiales bacterium]